MSVFGWILFGFGRCISGNLVMPGHNPKGFVLTILLGIIGALIGGFIGEPLTFYRTSELAGFVMSVIGATILLVIYHVSSEDGFSDEQLESTVECRQRSPERSLASAIALEICFERKVRQSNTKQITCTFDKSEQVLQRMPPNSKYHQTRNEHRGAD